jgi:hypothetical protein
MTGETHGPADGYFLPIDQKETPMGGYLINRDDVIPFRIGALLILCLSLAACTSDPNAPVNRTTPIRQMDSFFNSMSGPPPLPDYEHQPGYAPAYPAY